MKFPNALIQAWKAPGVKAAFVLDPPLSPDPLDCRNCGGVGYMASFVATVGPLRDPPGSKAVTHWTPAGWWIGSTITGACPVCSGKPPAKPRAYVRSPQGVVKRLAATLGIRQKTSRYNDMPTTDYAEDIPDDPDPDHDKINLALATEENWT